MYHKSTVIKTEKYQHKDNQINETEVRWHVDSFK